VITSPSRLSKTQVRDSCVITSPSRPSKTQSIQRRRLNRLSVDARLQSIAVSRPGKPERSQRWRYEQDPVSELVCDHGPVVSLPSCELDKRTPLPIRDRTPASGLVCDHDHVASVPSRGLCSHPRCVIRWEGRRRRGGSPPMPTVLTVDTESVDSTGGTTGDAVPRGHTSLATKHLRRAACNVPAINHA
jgi:hypothetical protein